ncbi:hypothetical protein ACOMHN_029547 [Nucella lapillus]
MPSARVFASDCPPGCLSARHSRHSLDALQHHPDFLYIGSSVNLRHRWANHKSDCKLRKGHKCHVAQHFLDKQHPVDPQFTCIRIFAIEAVHKKENLGVVRGQGERGEEGDQGFTLFFQSNREELLHVALRFHPPLPPWLRGTLVAGNVATETGHSGHVLVDMQEA